MKTKILVAISVFLSISVFGEVDREKAMAHGMWMMKYHLSPQPDSISEKLKKFQEAGMFSVDSKQYPILGFLSEAFFMHPERTEEWMMVIVEFPTQEKRICLTAAWLSGTAETAPYLDKNKELLTGQNYFGFDYSEQAQPIPSMKRTDVGYLDMNWGRYMFSGKEEPLRNVLSVLEFMDHMGASKKYLTPKSNEEKQAVWLERIGRAAWWSVNSNCKTIPGFKTKLGDLYLEKTLPPKSQNYLGLLLTEADSDRFYREEQPDGSLRVYMKKK